MSLDPFYEELCRRKHRGAWWWLIGDRVYFMGLVPTVLALPAALIGLLAGMMEIEWGWVCLRLSLVTVLVCAPLRLIGASLKRHAYRLAEGDGISAADVHDRS